MRNLSLTVIALFTGIAALFAQNVGVGTASPHASAKLHIFDANRGLLIPQVSLNNVTDGVNPVNAPANGLLVYNTNIAVTGGAGTGFYFWNGTAWEKLASGNVQDHDWYEVGTTSSPNSINDNIYTFGNVGIGTNSPTRPLHVVGTGLFDLGGGNIQLLKTAGNHAVWINSITPGENALLYLRTDGPHYWTFGADDNDADKFKFSDGVGFGSTRMTLDSDGNLGLGTTTPSTRLHVIGNALLNNNLNVNGNTVLGDANTDVVNINAATVTAPNLPGSLTNTNVLTLSGTGQLESRVIPADIWDGDANTTYTAGSGLSLTGTTFTNTAPDQVVTLTGAGATTVTGTYPNFTVTSTDNNTTYSAGTGITLTGATFSSTLGTSIETGEITDGTITAADLNQMGATNGQVLSWNGTNWAPNSIVNNDWTLTGNAGTSPLTNFLGTSDNIDMVFRTNNLERVRIRNNGNVGIGTNAPTQPLHVVGTGLFDLGGGNIQLLKTAGNHAVWINSITPGENALLYLRTDGPHYWTFGADDNDADKFKFSDGVGFGSTRMTLDSDGNLGLGTTTPSTRLHVIGNALLNNNLNVNGNTVLGDANTDVVNINAATVTAPNLPGSLTNTNVLTLSGTGQVETRVIPADIWDGDANTTYTAGSGLSLTGTTFANTAPDQVVTLTGAGATTVTGTYPNFTVTSTDNNTTYSAGTGITLTGTTFSSTLGTSIETGEITDGTITSADLNQMGALTNQVLTWNGTSWTPSAPSSDHDWYEVGTTNAPDNINDNKFSFGKIGMGINNPVANLHLVGNDGLLAVGTFGSGVIPATGAGTRMMWYPAKGAFRVGQVSVTQWDDVNIGTHSFAAGYNNTAASNYSTVFGANNIISINNPYCLISGNNNAFSGNGSSSSIIFGDLNLSNGLSSLVYGTENVLNSDRGFVGGQNDSVLSFNSVVAGGNRNSIRINSYCSGILSGNGNKIGDGFNTAMYGVINGGQSNIIFSEYCVINGGQYNSISGRDNNYSIIGGGQNNTISSSTISVENVVISGGYANTVTARRSVVGGGAFNSVSGMNSTISGGSNNSISSPASTIAGGSGNQVHSQNSVIAGGDRNTVAGPMASGNSRNFIGGGALNYLLGEYQTIGGGYMNRIENGYQAAIVGGQENYINTGSYGGFIGAGYRDTVLSLASGVMSGELNSVRASSSHSFIGGGYSNKINTNSSAATISGGMLNNLTGQYGFIGGGTNNSSSNLYTVIGGGESNVASGRNSFIGGGRFNTASGNNTTALGSYANTNNMAGSFVYSDASSATNTLAMAPNQFTVRASGGTIFYSNSTMTTGVSLAAGGGAWATISDRSKKENFETTDNEVILEKVAALPLSTWNYIAQEDSVRHMGPMAQDFHAAFGLGENNTSITTTDIDGVNMASIQALEKRTRDLKSENENLKAQLDAQAKELAEIKALLLQQAALQTKH
jgi:hypothetical protein